MKRSNVSQEQPPTTPPESEPEIPTFVAVLEDAEPVFDRCHRCGALPHSNPCICQMGIS